MLTISDFNDILVAFNTILVNHINFSVLHNYVRNSNLGKYIFLSLGHGDETWDLTVCYDAFYQVPVLFFLVNGQLDARENSMVEIHPILQTPYQMVHPCETSDIMNSLGKLGLEYLISWFGIHIGAVLDEIELRVNSIDNINE